MSIIFNQETKTFFLDGKGITYAFCVNETGYLEHLYFGETISHDNLIYTRTSGGASCPATIPGYDTPGLPVSYAFFQSELTFFGTGDYREPTVHVQNDEGDRLTELLFHSFEIVSEKPCMKTMPSCRGGETLIIHLVDRVSLFGADLYYTVYDDTEVIARRIVYKNGRNTPVKLLRAYSFALSLPENNYDILSLKGAWAQERHIQKNPLQYGVVSIDSKRTSSSATMNPFMALLSSGADEHHGDVYGVSLVYSSSYILKCEGTNDGQALLCGGINDFDFEWTLMPGEEFETPEALIAYSNEGLGKMSRAYHDVIRNHLMPSRFAKSSRPIVINNWEGTYFNFDNEKLMSIASAVAGTGVDTFVLDDGWFGKRESDTSGLGDWKVNDTKLKGGLDTIINHVNSLGMKFGLWFEPEMISEDSDIYRAHPEYAISAPNRPNCYSRHQFVMDLTNPDVRDYIVDSVNKIIQNHHIEYVKWDYNRNITESYSQSLTKSQQLGFAHRYAIGLYDLCNRIVEANPDIIFEGCASGGARFDLGILAYFPQIWTSDDTDANERTLIQYGTSIVYPLSSMSCHISVVPNHQTHRITPMKTRADIAHLGATGYELDTSAFSEEQRNEMREQIAEYKAMEELILEGDLYRSDNPFESNYFGFLLVSKDKTKAELTIYRRLGGVTFMTPVKRFRVPGLDKSKKYFVSELGITLGGDTLANVGLAPTFPDGDFHTMKFHFKEV